MNEKLVQRKERITGLRTGTEVGYAKKTWSNEQIVCDSFQNHMDAETRAFIRELSRRYISDSEANLEIRMREDLRFKELLSSLRYSLYLLATRGGDLSPERRSKQFDILRTYAEMMNITLSSECTEAAFSKNERPHLPEVTYTLRDMRARGRERLFPGLTREAVLAAFPDTDRYRLVEARIADTGSGYLPHKTTLYLPSKDEPWDRGVWGEGSKVNNANTVNDPNAFVISESTARTSDGSLKHWRRRMYSSSEKKHPEVLQRGFDESIAEGTTGSATIYRFAANGEPGVREAFDPRVTPLDSIVGDYGRKFIYPTLDISGFTVPPGISLELGTQQYLQGLRIGTGTEGFLFSYDFSQKEGLLSGRDRKHIDYPTASKMVEQLWHNIEDAQMVCELAKRVFDSSRTFPESPALVAKLSDSGRWASALPEALNLSLSQRNVFVPAHYAISPELAEHANIVRIKPVIRESYLIKLVIAVRKLRPDYDVVYISEIERPTESAAERPWTERESTFIHAMDAAVALEAEWFAPFHTSLPYVKLPPVMYKRAEHARVPELAVTRSDHKTKVTMMLPEDVDRIPVETFPEKFASRIFMARLVSRGIIDSNFNYVPESSVFWNNVAQTAAQSILNEISRRSDISLIPRELEQRLSALIGEQGLGTFGPEAPKGSLFDVLSAKRQVRAGSITWDDIRDIAEKSCASGSPFAKLQSETIPRIMSDGRKCSFFTYESAAQKLIPHHHVIELSDLPLFAKWHGLEVRQLPDGRLLIPVATPAHSVLRREYRDDTGRLQTSQELCLEDDILLINGSYIQSSIAVQSINVRGQVYPRLDRGCIIAHEMNDLEGWEFISPDPERNAEEEPVREGVMNSPLTLEYINELWEDPRRIFQDLRQNHEDAAKEPPHERFLVEVDGVEAWVLGEEVGDREILGYELSDSGPGYPPNGIQNMGHSEKRNPMLTGKNGEGLKLAAASALKAGFHLEYASTGNDGDEEVMWRADAIARSIPDDTEGKSRVISQLAFDVRTQDRSELAGAGARTRVRLPAGADAAVKERWKAWASIVDPRKRNGRGERGLDRYVLSEANLGDRVSVGPVTLFFDRPGQVYENRNLIRNEPQDAMTMRMGWIFPNITDTRERDRYDSLAVRGYVRYFFENTDNERAVRTALLNMFTQEEDTRSGETSVHFAETELSPEFALDNILYAPSLPLFQRVARQVFPGKILYCEEMFHDMSESARGNVRHIPFNKRLTVPVVEYNILRHILPNMHEYAEHLSTVTLDVPEESLAPIRNQVCASARNIEKRLTLLRDDPKTAPLYRLLVERSGVSQQTLLARLGSMDPRLIAGTPGDVFVGPDESKWAGLATGSGGIGINVNLLAPSRWPSLSSTIDHEIAHQITGAADYSDAFIAMLSLLALSKSVEKN